ncbi:MAG: hypothetical protein QOK33_5566 [Mycobacterium sp.]|jgi:hypothetical protein|nr:hypothetical protein [Mycobacterium sp.]MDT5402335.1 hypothetical protein [Mycobacterium sp.]
MVEEHSAKGGFHADALPVAALDLWAEGLKAHESEVIEIQSEEVFER